MSTPLVFKFGGASVKDAQSVRNVASIIGQFSQRPMVVVVSAMGKMTNAFEEVVAAWSNGNLSEANAKIDAIAAFHQVSSTNSLRTRQKLMSKSQPLFQYSRRSR